MPHPDDFCSASFDAYMAEGDGQQEAAAQASALFATIETLVCIADDASGSAADENDVAAFEAAHAAIRDAVSEHREFWLKYAAARHRAALAKIIGD